MTKDLIPDNMEQAFADLYEKNAQWYELLFEYTVDAICLMRELGFPPPHKQLLRNLAWMANRVKLWGDIYRWERLCKYAYCLGGEIYQYIPFSMDWLIPVGADQSDPKV